MVEFTGGGTISTEPGTAPAEKKTFNMGKAFRRNQTFVIQIAISIALPPFGCEALDGYIQLGAVTQVSGTSDTQLLIRGCSL